MTLSFGWICLHTLPYSVFLIRVIRSTLNRLLSCRISAGFQEKRWQQTNRQKVFNQLSCCISRLPWGGGFVMRTFFFSFSVQYMWRVKKEKKKLPNSCTRDFSVSHWQGPMEISSFSLKNHRDTWQMLFFWGRKKKKTNRAACSAWKQHATSVRACEVGPVCLSHAKRAAAMTVGQKAVRVEIRLSTCRPAPVCTWKCEPGTFGLAVTPKVCDRTEVNMPATDRENERELENKKRGRRQRCSRVPSVQVWVWRETHTHTHTHTHTMVTQSHTPTGFTSAWCGSTRFQEVKVHVQVTAQTHTHTHTHAQANRHTQV